MKEEVWIDIWHQRQVHWVTGSDDVYEEIDIATFQSLLMMARKAVKPCIKLSKC
jgi:hypothetical protein